ncbi:MAG TPA: NUDIX domain-containing protein [Streptosporangiaceae bacterium]|nr:NUDIX domain-containing protein [Streptosporangiaceae bacterium]
MSGRQGRPCRVDYWHDPAAPKPTSRKPSASVIVRNSAGDLLLLRRSDSGRWTIPTGGLKKHETLTQCAVRECREETGLDIEITALVGVFSDPGHVIAYADGEVRQPVNTCFSGQVIGGNLTTSDEATEAVWVPPPDSTTTTVWPCIRPGRNAPAHIVRPSPSVRTVEERQAARPASCHDSVAIVIAHHVVTTRIKIDAKTAECDRLPGPGEGPLRPAGPRMTCLDRRSGRPHTTGIFCERYSYI